MTVYQYKPGDLVRPKGKFSRLVLPNGTYCNKTINPNNIGLVLKTKYKENVGWCCEILFADVGIFSFSEYNIIKAFDK